VEADLGRAVDSDPELVVRAAARTETEDRHLATAVQCLSGSKRETSARPSGAVELERELGEGLGLALRGDAVLLNVVGDVGAMCKFAISDRSWSRGFCITSFSAPALS
jgi:hypothetical protein